MAELAGVMVGNYFLLECLGREGMVETYRARPTTRGGFDVVLRLFRPQFPDPTAFQEHFASEVEKVWHCHHEHIQPLLEFGAGDGLLYSVAELIEAKTLEQILQEAEEEECYTPIQMPLIVHYITQICNALQYAHEQGIVHGNIQPSSILVQDDQHILLTNFSMKRIYHEDEPMVAQIEEGNAAYTAPEQVVGMLSPASDIYAIGVLLYRLLAGCLPYDGDSAGEIALKHTNDAIPVLRALCPNLPESVELVVRVALAKSPEARFPSPNALAEALVAAVTADSPPVVTITPQRRIEVRSRRTPFTWSRAFSLLAISIILFGLVGTLYFFPTLPLSLRNIPGLPFHAGGQGGVVGIEPGKPASTTTSSGTTTSSTTSVRGSNSGLPVQPMSTPGQPQTPVVNGTASPTTPAIPLVFLCTPGSLSLDSSVNLQPLLQQINADYATICPAVTISLRADGSRTSLNLVQHGRIVAAASDLTANPARNLTDHPIGALLYALIVSPDVQVSGLSSAEIRGIYQGKITNWAQVGGSNEAIRVILPPPTASITAIFQTFVLNDTTEHVAGIRIKKDAPAMVAQTVSQTPGAIGYVPLEVAQGTSVQVLAIDGISPSIQTLLQGTYAFWSAEHFYTQSIDTPQLQAYLQFFQSNQGMNVMLQFDAVPINMINENILSSHLPGPEF
jgi:ABC-type phosphate transport system substrate-binding protein